MVIEQKWEKYWPQRYVLVSTLPGVMQNILGLVLSTPVLVTGVGFPFPVSIPMALSLRSSSISFVKLIAFPNIPLKFCLLHSGKYELIFILYRLYWTFSVCGTEEKYCFDLVHLFQRMERLTVHTAGVNSSILFVFQQDIKAHSDLWLGRTIVLCNVFALKCQIPGLTKSTTVGGIAKITKQLTFQIFVRRNFKTGTRFAICIRFYLWIKIPHKEQIYKYDIILTCIDAMYRWTVVHAFFRRTYQEKTPKNYKKIGIHSEFSLEEECPRNILLQPRKKYLIFHQFMDMEP